MVWWCGGGGVVVFLTDDITTPTKVVLSCFGLFVGLWQYLYDGFKLPRIQNVLLKHGSDSISVKSSSSSVSDDVSSELSRGFPKKNTFQKSEPNFSEPLNFPNFP